MAVRSLQCGPSLGHGLVSLCDSRSDLCFGSLQDKGLALEISGDGNKRQIQTQGQFHISSWQDFFVSQHIRPSLLLLSCTEILDATRVGSSRLYPCSRLSGQVQAVIKLQIAFYCPLAVLQFYCVVHFFNLFFFSLSSRVEISGGYYEYIDVSSCQDIIHLYHLLWSATILNIVGLFLGIITAAILGGFKDMVR